ncbi:MAG: phosphoribosylamine--glycine ligase [Cyclobacteriaceae bacterium]
MNILVVGSGGREHALAWKIKQSPQCNDLFIAPGNAGTAEVGKNVAINAEDFTGLGEFCVQKNIALVVVGPEGALVAGIRDFFEADKALAHIAIVGPGKAGAALEGSKDFSKQFMLRNKIPTAKAQSFEVDQIQDAYAYLDKCDVPIVLKADGLAAGKGVVISQTIDEAKGVLREMLEDKKFGEASSKVLIEQFLEGIELSVFVMTDGNSYVTLPEAKDYKRIGEGDTGPNTGGMGAISPVTFADKEFMKRVEERVTKPTIDGLRNEKIDYRGFIFIGLMNVQGDPYVIEYNVRMGDPETQAVLPRIESDFVELLKATATGKLAGHMVRKKDEVAATVVMVAEGYPGSYGKGMKIEGLNEQGGALVFHAGTKSSNDDILTNGGRVLAVTGMGKDLAEATARAYSKVSDITWDGLYFRSDIGKDLMNWSGLAS